MNVRCGSQASSGAPVVVRSAETTQLLDPVAGSGRPSVSRTRAIWAIRSLPSPAKPTPGAVTIGWPRGYCGSSFAARSGPAALISSARSSSISQLVESPNASSFADASRSVTDQGSNPIRRSWNSSGSARALSAPALMPAA